MNQPADTTPLSFQTVLSATEADALPDAPRPVLLGTYITPEGGRALIRTSRGELRQLRVGDRIGQARIDAIGTGRLDMMLLNQPHRLTIPGTG